MNMNKFKNVTLVALLLVLLTTLFSCSKNTIDDIHRTTFKWTSDYTGDPRNITVPAEGGTYSWYAPTTKLCDLQIRLLMIHQ